ncbi:choice-of-anchor D domain-containing protein [Geobacter sulfurreducens]|uniref:choice-of-anchor D domain-containing protein n=1 Tax=Geobacter sulfurreducens TaxID=35554 RepID=UPI000DBB69B2|nr:choice-of-anchor D domain-containing protein [Geobacter sulfurreducens]BBA69893.1 Spore coat protein A [Geobacter sulfurreducens]
MTSARMLLATAIAILTLGSGTGTALAFLKPDKTPIGPGDTPDYLTTPNWANSPPMRKFVDTLPGLGSGNANNLGQFLSVAVPDITTYPGSDYYEIELRQYSEQMHSDLPPTTLRGYVQVNNGTDTTSCTDPSLNLANPCTTANNTVAPSPGPRHLGPIIVAQKDRPVRVKFINKLPTGAGGNLFIPVDQTVMGSGPFQIDYDPVTKQATALKSGTFTQNRAELHLHGGRTPWISDGTPHQWITPAGEMTDYPTGVSVENVPDMPDPGPGAQTYYWTNQQSSRMLFYHDHAWGITRLNVYVGEAAGYLIRDAVEQELITAGTIPSAELPLVIEDKTFVDPATIVATDPTWAWGTQPWTGTGPMTPVKGDLWWPHVYMPAQNPFDITGIAPMGRWAYGPYFWPATNNPFQPIPNPYYSAACDPAGDPATTPGLLGGPYGQFCQPPEIPSTPNPSWGAEAFMDTPLVNGTAYPVVDVDPKPYRLRVLNANHDRFVNLQLYKADPAVDPNATPGSDAKCLALGGCATETEVKMLPALDYSTDPTWPATWPADGRPGGIPDWTTRGPDWVMIGTEGGFLPKPVVIPSHPVTWNNDVTTFNAGNVNGGSLILGPAERADVIVDFSQYAGQTLILYNDAPAPWPALDPHYDYYTGSPDNRAMGGADTTLAGFGPNTRTIMKIRVAAGAGAPFNLAALQAAFTSGSNSGGQPSVFQRSQDPIIVGQGNMNPAGDPAVFSAFLFPETYDAYNKAYDRVFPTSWPNWGVSRINDKVLNFIGSDGSTTYQYNPADTTPLPWDPTKTTKGGMPMKFKAIQDEQGETFDDYGRMRAALGLELITPGAGRVNFIVQTYSDPATEVLQEDGIQIWKITHNGVDTHPVHFHLFDVQVLNRVGWDGFIRLPDPTELGWKDTVRISPLEDTIVAMKPVKPKMPFGIPNSFRPLNPATPLGDTTELSMVDPTTGQAWATPNINRLLNFDWEYVWHCHILSHEENDMMRPMQFIPVTNLPDAPTLNTAIVTVNSVVLNWTDSTPPSAPTTLGNPKNEIGFRVERCAGSSCTDFAPIGTALANATSYTDLAVNSTTTYNYRLVAYNALGDSPVSNVLSANTAIISRPIITVSPLTVNFGNVTVGFTSSPTNITVANTGQLPLDVTAFTPSGGNAAMFTIQNGSCGTLPVTIAPAANCTFSITFAPTAAGIVTANLQIASNDAASPVPNISLNGTGISPTTNPVRINTTYYPSLAAAFTAAASGNTVQAFGVLFVEPAVNLNTTGTVTFRGGYDALFGTSTGMTTLQGVLTITNGALVVNNLTIQ